MITRIFATSALFLVCGASFAQKPETQPPPPIACTWDELDRIAKVAIKDFITSGGVPHPNGAVGFSIAGVEQSGEVDPQTGYAKEVIFPFSVVNKSGQPIGGGLFRVSGACKVLGGALEISQEALPINPL